MFSTLRLLKVETKLKFDLKDLIQFIIKLERITVI